jgi:hypothetical protein
MAVNGFNFQVGVYALTKVILNKKESVLIARLVSIDGQSGLETGVCSESFCGFVLELFPGHQVVSCPHLSSVLPDTLGGLPDLSSPDRCSDSLFLGLQDACPSTLR